MSAPQGYGYGGSGSGGGGPVATILRDDREGPDASGYYSFNVDTSDGIRRQEQGQGSGPNGAVVQQGSYSFTFPDGTPAEFSFVADENGFQPVSNLLPTPHPLPAHAIAQIEFARQQGSQGNRGGSASRNSYSPPQSPSNAYNF
ncbi:unnamed protein product, partial [Meganyctiphanes norvegica]